MIGGNCEIQPRGNQGLHCQGYEEAVNTADEGGGAPPHPHYGMPETTGTPKGKEGYEEHVRTHQRAPSYKRNPQS